MLDSVWVLKVIVTDECTYSVEEIIAICTDLDSLEKNKKEAISKGLNVFEEKIKTNEIFAY